MKNFAQKHTNYLLLLFMITSFIIFISCNKDASKNLTLTYLITSEKLISVGVTNITMEYNEETKSALITFSGISRKALGTIVDLNNVSITANFSKEDALEKISFLKETLTFFSIKNEVIEYAYRSKHKKRVPTSQLMNATLNLSPNEQVLSLIFTSLYQDLNGFKLKKNIEIVQSVEKVKKNPNFMNTIEVGCYQIGGSTSAVQERLKSCSKDGCIVVGTDVSCLWGNHACFGTVTYSCGAKASDGGVSFDNTPHFFS